MGAFLLKVHRVAVSYSFYPLLLSSILALGFFAARVLYSRTFNYGNLPWNLLLAWLPYGFSLLTIGLHRKKPAARWLLLPPAIAWLVFFPNAPYIVTDFYHLAERSSVPLWYDIGLIAIFAFTGLFLAIASLRVMHLLVDKLMGRLVGWCFAAIVLGFAGLGIYIGRFERWNSWDLLSHPLSIFKNILSRLFNPFENLRFIGFTLMFTAILFVFYLTFVSLTQARQSKESS